MRCMNQRRVTTMAIAEGSGKAGNLYQPESIVMRSLVSNTASPSSGVTPLRDLPYMTKNREFLV